MPVKEGFTQITVRNEDGKCVREIKKAAGTPIYATIRDALDTHFKRKPKKVK